MGEVGKERGNVWTNLLKSLTFSYLVTLVLLFILALVVFKWQIGAGPVSGAIIGIYIAVNLLAGRMLGKRMGTRKFLWGLAQGAGYFVILFLLSLLFGAGGMEAGDAISAFFLCAGSGMFGGMTA
ncbi:MAG: TIGR04086 family membrane protein [Acetatifactor sp.]